MFFSLSHGFASGRGQIFVFGKGLFYFLLIKNKEKKVIFQALPIFFGSANSVTRGVA